MNAPYTKLVMIVLLAAGAVFAGGALVNAQDKVDAELAAAITKLNAEQKAALLVLVNGIVQGNAPQESPEEGAMKTVKAYVKAAEDADVEGLMAQISDHFNHYEVGDKAALRGFVEQIKTEGKLEDIRGNTADAKTEVEDDVVTVYPVELEGIFGTVTYEFKLKKEGDSWKIVGFDITGI